MAISSGPACLAALLGRDFLSSADLTPEQTLALLELAADLKVERGNAVEGCGRLAALQERRSKLALGAALLEQGLITQEQFQQLGASIARDLGISAASSGSLALPTKPVYEPPPPVNLGPTGPSKPSGAKPFKPRFPPVDTGSGTGSGTPGAAVPAPAAAGAKKGGLSRPAR